MAKPKIATTSLAGCFGCHMSLLDIDERILQLIELVDFDKSPIDDIKKFSGRCAVGLIEGGCCNEENVHVLHEFLLELLESEIQSAPGATGLDGWDIGVGQFPEPPQVPGVILVFALHGLDRNHGHATERRSNCL